jgi:hypothetical protein
MIPILYDRLIDNLSTNQAPPAKEGTIWTKKLLMNHHPATSIAFHIKLPKIVAVRLFPISQGQVNGETPLSTQILYEGGIDFSGF